jgi:hypothetical protein
MVHALGCYAPPGRGQPAATPPSRARRSRRRTQSIDCLRSLVNSIGLQRLLPKTVVPTKAGTHRPAFETTEGWVPAFPTDQVRGLKAHGTTI